MGHSGGNGEQEPSSENELASAERAAPESDAHAEPEANEQPEANEATEPAARVAPPGRGPVGRWTRAEIIVLVLLTLVAGGLRLWALGYPGTENLTGSDPPGAVFDETYYVKDACWYAYASESTCNLSDESTKVHPPLGKWMISAGVKAFGFDPFGWRIIPALAGIFTVPLLFALARRLFRSLVGATLAAGLMAVDFLQFVQSRTSMLDIFVLFFGVAAFLCLAIDRDRLLAGAVGRGHALARPWRAAAGALGGAAAASKWSGAFFIAALFLVSIAWETSARRETANIGRGRALWSTIKRETPSLLLYLVVLPFAVYTVTFLGRLHGEPLLSIPWTEGSWGRALWERHVYMFNFHTELTSTHTYQSPGWSWILLKRPVSYFFCSGSSCTPSEEAGIYREIFASGSPFVWWSSLMAFVWVAMAWVRRRDFRRAEGLILAGLLFTYGPWLLPPLLTPVSTYVPWVPQLSDRSAIFVFYLLPVIPFMCLAIGYVATRIGDSWEAKAAIALYSAIAIGFFAFYYPLLAGTPIQESHWRARIWIFDDCDKPPGETITTTGSSIQPDGSTTWTTGESNASDSLPPKGWCWI